MSEWKTIDSAPKGSNEGIVVIILGYAPDEENFSPSTRTGFWSWSNKEWRFDADPTWKHPPQPTHWMPLPEPPPILSKAEKV